MSIQPENNKRIAKNTLLLYFRMLLTLPVSLYTSRVILQSLGVEDYGIYNVVGGVVSVFSILSGSLSASISRFFTFELGKNNIEKLKRVFSSALTIQIILAIVVIIFAQSIGLWFLNNKLVIPENRIIAANWLYQFSIISFAINLIGVPYNSAIIAHERMAAFAYISVLEVICKFIVALSIAISPIDKLIFYGLLLMLTSIIIRLVYRYYCKNKFIECCYKFCFDKKLLRQMFSFAGWNFIGASSVVLRDQGGNILINLFCGPKVNAAQAIAMQVSYTIQGFVTNFTTALNPQITKSYASGNLSYMMTLIFQGARLSFYILLILSLPIIINAKYILSLWLGVVPEHTVAFVQLVLIFIMSESLASPLITAMLATGKIRNYQLIVGGLQTLNLPISYVLLRMGFYPEVVFITAIVISVCCEFARLFMLKDMINLPVRMFLKKVYFNVICVFATAFIIPTLCKYFLDENFLNFCLICVICIICTLLSILFIGCKSNERLLVYQKSYYFIKKILKK